MAKAVALPFEVPTFATVQTSGAAELAMIGHPSAHNQLLNQGTNIGCTNRFLRGFTTPQVSIPNITVRSYNFMEKYHVNFRFLLNFCMDVIKSMLDENMYIYYNKVDDFYLPGKSWYGTRHMHHDAVMMITMEQ